MINKKEQAMREEARAAIIEALTVDRNRNVSPDRKAGSLKGDLKMKCVNCGSIEDGNMVVNMGCGHAEYICDDCCRVLDTIHYDLDKDIWYCEDKCLKCYN